MLSKSHLSARELWDEIVSRCSQDEIELNRAWLYNKNDNNRIGATLYVMQAEEAKRAFEELNSQSKLSYVYSDFDTFLKEYNPETDGETIYKYAKDNTLLIDDIGEVIYSER